MAGVLRQARTLADLVKWEHTIFALPFAYIGALLAAGGWPGWKVMFWITVAMFGGRTAAMALNRLIDRAIDALNPRTATRHLPAGLVSAGQVLALAVASLGLLLLAAWSLNPLCLTLLPLVVVVLVGYSYTKRFTWACHLVLGISYFWVPFGGWIAVTGQFAWAPLWLGVSAGLWVAGFDILYATQDREFDRKIGLHSIPARFGLARSLVIARWLHIVTVAVLIAVGAMLGLGLWYWLGIVVVAGLLVYEHALLSPQDMSRLDAAFFNVNGYISLAFLAFTVAEIALGKGVA